MHNFRRLLFNEEAAVLAEYVLAAGLIAGVAVAAARALGPIVAAKFQSGAAAFDSGGPAPGGSPPPPPTGGSAPVSR